MAAGDKKGGTGQKKTGGAQTQGSRRGGAQAAAGGTGQKKTGGGGQGKGARGGKT